MLDTHREVFEMPFTQTSSEKCSFNSKGFELKVEGKGKNINGECRLCVLYASKSMFEVEIKITLESFSSQRLQMPLPILSCNFFLLFSATVRSRFFIFKFAFNLSSLFSKIDFHLCCYHAKAWM